MAKKVLFFEDDLKVIFKEYMGPAGFLQDGQEIVGFEIRTRRIKAGGDYTKDAIPEGLEFDGPIEEIKKIYVLVKG
jgi:hypothetical protein